MAETPTDVTALAKLYAEADLTDAKNERIPPYVVAIAQMLARAFLKSVAAERELNEQLTFLRKHHDDLHRRVAELTGERDKIREQHRFCVSHDVLKDLLSAQDGVWEVFDDGDVHLTLRRKPKEEKA